MRFEEHEDMQILDMMDEGRCLAETARDLGRSYDSVRGRADRLRKLHGIPTPPVQPPFNLNFEVPRKPPGTFEKRNAEFLQRLRAEWAINHPETLSQPEPERTPEPEPVRKKRVFKHTPFFEFVEAVEAVPEQRMYVSNPHLALIAISRVSGIPVTVLRGKDRQRHITRWRMVGYHLLHEDGMGTAAIGRWFGDRDHSTVVHGLSRVRKDPETFDHMVRAVKTRLAAMEALN